MREPVVVWLLARVDGLLARVDGLCARSFAPAGPALAFPRAFTGPQEACPRAPSDAAVGAILCGVNSVLSVPALGML